MASCWKSFSPKYARQGPATLNSLVTTVVTPSKCVGRDAPSMAAPSWATWTVVRTGRGYISASEGVNATSAPAAPPSSRSRSSGRG